MNTELNALAVLALVGALWEQVAIRDEQIRHLKQQLAEKADQEGDG